MIKYLLLVFIFIFSSPIFSTESFQLEIILVRHAEKQKGPDPSLNGNGRRRADALAGLDAYFKISAIYSSNFNRTLQTVLPLSQHLGIQINKSISAVAYGQLLSDMKKNFNGKTLFVVGHSNTIPNFINFVNPDFEVPLIDESDYSNFFVLKIENKNTSLEKYLFEAHPKTGKLEIYDPIRSCYFK